MAGTKYCCVRCVAACDNEWRACLIEMQFGEELEKSVVVQAACPQGNFKSIIAAVTSATNVHKEHDDHLEVGHQQRIYGGLRDAIFEGFGPSWK